MSYQGTPGGPSDPKTPGSYCLTRCYCGTCPQYAEQQQRVETQRQQEIAVRLGRQLRDDGIRRTTRNMDPTWRAQVDQAINQLAATGEPFTADSVRALGVPEPSSPQQWGARFQAAARAGVIRRIGYQPSQRASVHAHPVATWQGAA